MEWRERLVQTICEARNAYFADDVEHRRDGRDPDEVIADAILSAIDAAGCVIVPRVCVRCGRTIERPKQDAGLMLAMAEVGRRAPGDWMVHEVDERRWYAVHTKARAEWLVHKGLREQGYETLYLHRRATVSHARRKIGVLRPYFPRYVFVAVGPRQSVYAVNTTIGVSTVVYAGLDPLEIPAEVISELRARGDENGLVEERGPEARKRLKRGQQVRIAGGPFEGLLALVALDSGNAIRVWLDAFGGKVEAILDPSGLEPVSPEWRS